MVCGDWCVVCEVVRGGVWWWCLEVCVLEVCVVVCVGGVVVVVCVVVCGGVWWWVVVCGVVCGGV